MELELCTRTSREGHRSLFRAPTPKRKRAIYLALIHQSEGAELHVRQPFAYHPWSIDVNPTTTPKPPTDRLVAAEHSTAKCTWTVLIAISFTVQYILLIQTSSKSTI